MTVSLPLLPAGTYVVFWRTHSADDGHVAAGSYLFHIKRADGTVPPLTGALPTGSSIGAAGVATFGSLEMPRPKLGWRIFAPSCLPSAISASARGWTTRCWPIGTD